MTQTAASTVKTTVLQRNERQFSFGTALPFTLREVDEAISAGLVGRLVRYANKRMADSGFSIPGNWQCEVSTCDADRPPSDRVYCVEWHTLKGGRIGVQGIMTNRGHVAVDHGIFADD